MLSLSHGIQAEEPLSREYGYGNVRAVTSVTARAAGPSPGLNGPLPNSELSGLRHCGTGDATPAPSRQIGAGVLSPDCACPARVYSHTTTPGPRLRPYAAKNETPRYGAVGMTVNSYSANY